MPVSTTQGLTMAVRTPGAPDRQVNPDAELTRSFAVGCLVLFVAFLLLSALVFDFWSRS